MIYLSNSGELTAMFVVSYQPDPQIAQELYELERKGIGLIVRSTDPNLTAEKSPRFMIYRLRWYMSFRQNYTVILIL